MKTEFLPTFLRLVLSSSVNKKKKSGGEDRVYGEEEILPIKLLKTDQDTSSSFKIDICLITIEFLKLPVNLFTGSFVIRMSSQCINNLTF